MHLHEALSVLGLASIPSDASEVKRAWRSAAMHAHPDRGGSSAAFVRVQAATEALIEAMSSPIGYDRSRHGAPLNDRLVLPGPVAPSYQRQPLVDLRTWWREQAMLELGFAGLGNWTREGTMRGGVVPVRGKVRR
jgi:hypothetical protein